MPDPQARSSWRLPALLALVIALPLGILTAYKAGSWFDKITNTSAFGLLALPGFVLGLILIYFLGVKAKVLPVSDPSGVPLTTVHFQLSGSNPWTTM